MSDYMSGYNSRYRRRRKRYERKYHAVGKRAYRARKRSRRQTNEVVTWTLRIGVCLVILTGIFFLIKYIAASNNTSDSQSKVTTTASAVSGQAVSSQAVATTTVEPGGLAEIVDKVEPIPADSIVAPTPAPRSKAVALTFDDGPSTSFTNSILDVLEEYNAHATFFVLGERAQAGAELLKRQIALGCEIGSHSWDHTNLSKVKIKTINKQNRMTSDIVERITGYKIKLMRPPYGAISDVMRKKMKYPMILWSVDTLDWKTKNAKAVLKEVKKQVSDGDIILVHDIHGSTAEAMKKVIPWLVENDYDILTVSELMERKGVELKNGVAYGSAR